MIARTACSAAVLLLVASAAPLAAQRPHAARSLWVLSQSTTDTLDQHARSSGCGDGCGVGLGVGIAVGGAIGLFYSALSDNRTGFPILVGAAMGGFLGASAGGALAGDPDEGPPSPAPADSAAGA